MKYKDLFLKRYQDVTLYRKTSNSIIYFAYDELLKEKVALKFIPTTSAFYQGVSGEFKILLQFKHPNLVKVLDYGHLEDKGIYYTMPKYETIDPVRFCKIYKMSGFLEIFFQLLCGLNYLHQRAKHHGDMTLENLLFTQEGKEIIVKISDFGLSSLVAANKISEISGTARYLAPELLKSKKKISIRTDLYSLGIILYEIISGNPPFSEEDVLEQMKARLNRKIPPIKALFKTDNKIEPIIRKLLENDPVKRYQNCREVQADLNPILQKYGLKEDEGNLVWQNVLTEMREKGKIGIRFFRRSALNELIKRSKRVISEKDHGSIVAFVGDSSNCLEDTLLFLSYELKKLSKNVFFWRNFEKDFASENDLRNIILGNLSRKFSCIDHSDFRKWEAQIPEFIIIIPNVSKLGRKEKELFNLFLRSKNLKLIFGTNEQLGSKLTDNAVWLYNLRNFSNIEMEEYLNLVFGIDILPDKIADTLLRNSTRNVVMLNSFIDHYIKKGIISYRNLQWYFDESKLSEEDIPEQIKKKYAGIFKKLPLELRSFLILLSNWNDHFKAEVVTKLSGLSAMVVNDMIERSKQQKILIQPSKMISFRYPFISVIFKQQCDENTLAEQSRRIISYLKKKNNITAFNEKRLFRLLMRYEDFRQALQLAEDIISRNRRNVDMVVDIGTEVYEHKQDMNSANADSFLKIFNHYVWALEKNGDYQKAIDVFEFQKEKIDLSSDLDLKNETFIRELYFLNRKNSFARVIDLYNKSRKRISGMPEPQKVRAIQHIAYAYKLKDNSRKQIELLEEILEICSRVKDDSLLNQEFTALEDLGFARFQTGNIEKALEIFKRGAQIADRMNNPANNAYIFSRIASIYIDLNQYDNTLKYLRKAEKVMEKCEVKYPLLTINNTYGNLYLAMSNYWSALCYYHKAYLFFREQKEDFSVPLGNKSFPLNYLGYYEQAIDCLLRTIDYKEKLGQTGSLGVWKTNLMYSYYLSGRKKDADCIFREILELEKNGNNPANFYAHYYRGYFAIRENRFQRAEDEISFLKKVSIEEKSDEFLLSYNFLKAKLLWETGRIPEADAAVSECLNRFEKTGNSSIESQELYLLAYIIKKRYFSQNPNIDNYKNYLLKAKKILDDKVQNLPTNIMRQHFLNLEINRKIDEYNELEMLQKQSGKYINRFNILEIIEEMTGIISKVNDQDKLFNKILKLAVKVTDAERGLILKKNPETGIADVKFSFQVGRESLSDITSVSREIIAQVLKKKKAVYKTNVNTDKTFDEYRSFVNLKIESVVCLPLLIHNRVLGTVYLDSRSLLAFTPEEIQFLNIFAHIAASAIETSESYCQLKQEKEKLAYLVQDSADNNHPGIIGNSTEMQKLFKKIEQISVTDVNVLIEGESGTGKELVAKDIHRLSRRSEKPFIPIDCGSLSEEVVESELFGHIKGAFTGAFSDKKGLFEEADPGTLFLDEISNISLGTQAKLLRVLQEGEMKRIGENKVRKVNVRTIVASNIPLDKLVAEGKFRQDLYFRLSIFPIKIPALSRRNDDIVLLAQHFLKYYNTLHNKEIRAFGKDSLQILQEYNWPGNVRQLQNEIERAVIMSGDMDKVLSKSRFQHLSSDVEQMPLSLDSGRNLTELVDNYRLKIIEQALKVNDLNQTKAAKMLGISRQNLHQIYKRLQK